MDCAGFHKPRHAGACPAARSRAVRACFPALILLLALLAGTADAAAREADGNGAPSPALVIKPLPGELGEQRALAQRIAVGHPEVQRRVVDRASGKPLRAAVFGVEQARAGDITEHNRSCEHSTCYRVDVYNYALNASLMIMVDVVEEQLVSVSPYQRGQPELPDYLLERALEIAAASPAVEKALGFSPDKDTAVMAGVKTALNDTECESSRHLCVAPTFVFERAERALWAIVDLTDERLAGVRWTDLGYAKTVRPTEQSVQRDRVYEEFCRQKRSFSRDGWRFEYIITSSDGLEISDLTYNGRPVLDSAKLVDWHVSYSERDGFGYSDAIGCPKFSSAAIGALSGPEVEPIEGGGFAFIQDFFHPLWPAPCNYRYKQRFEFFDDGRFRVAGGQYGRGCGLDGTYRPVFRIEPAVSADATFSEWDGEDWRAWETEQWQLQGPDTPYTEEGYQYRLDAGAAGWYLEPGTGQFADNRGDHAYVYVTRSKEGDGDADMITIGPCCNTDHRQGPEQFIGDPPEPLEGDGLVIWYVAQLDNDGRRGQEYCWAENAVIDGIYEPVSWPCYAGPMFVPAEGRAE